jgi:hypothetical protein
MALQLQTYSFGPIDLAAPAGGIPSHIAFTLTSSGEPFCIVGLRIDPSPAGRSPWGQVKIALHRINGMGLIHEDFELAQGVGLRPQDLVVSYGSVFSSSSSLSFHIVQWPTATGAGAAFKFYGIIVFFADETGTLTATSGTP